MKILVSWSSGKDSAWMLHVLRSERIGSPPALARDMIAGGLDARLTCVDPQAVPAALAGRAFDASLLADLPSTAGPCGERGEFHTCVTAGHMFSRPVPAVPGGVVERDGFVFADLLPARPDAHEDRVLG